MSQKMHIINQAYAIYNRDYTELREANAAERREILDRSEVRIGSEKCYRIEHHFSEADEKRIEFLRSESQRLYALWWDNPHSKVLCGSTSAEKNGRVRTGNRSLWAEPREIYNNVKSSMRCQKCRRLA